MTASPILTVLALDGAITAADVELPSGVEIAIVAELTPAVLQGLTSQYVIILEPRQWLSAAALTQLVSLVEPRRAIVFPGARMVNGQPQWDTRANRQISRWTGREVTFEQIPLAASPGVGRCVPVGVVQALAGLWKSDQTTAWWAEVFWSAGQTILVPNPDMGLRLYQGPDQTCLSGSIGRSLRTWQALAELDECYDCLGSVTDALAQGESDRLGARVRGDHADHAELVAALETAGRSDELAQVNQAAARRLVVSYAFPPYLDTAGLVAAKRLVGWAEPYDLICHDLSPRAQIDQRTFELVKPWIGGVTTVPGRPRTHREGSLAAWCRAGLAAVRARERQFGQYELMYSRSMWPASQVLAALLKARQPNLNWTAELSDPLLINSLGQMRQAPLWDSPEVTQINQAILDSGLPLVTDRGFFGWLEGVVYALADDVIMTNQNQYQFMTNYPESTVPGLSKDLASRLAEVVQIEAQPVPPSVWYNLGQSFFGPDDDTRVRLAYFGVFYATRGVDDVLQAFIGLNSKERQQLQFDLFTNNPSEVTAAAAASGLSEVVKAHSMLPYLDFLATAKQCDWLIVADAQTSVSHGLNPYRPSKLSDYRGSGARIWGLIEPGSAMSREPLDATTNLGDLAAASATLRRIMTSPRNGQAGHSQ